MAIVSDLPLTLLTPTHLQWPVVKTCLFKAWMMGSGVDFVLLPLFVYFTTPWHLLVALWIFWASLGEWDQESEACSAESFPTH